MVIAAYILSLGYCKIATSKLSCEKMFNFSESGNMVASALQLQISGGKNVATAF